MEHLFTDYPVIAQGLRRLNISTPTDFQLQLLSATALEQLIVTAPAGCGKTVGLLLSGLRGFSSE